MDSKYIRVEMPERVRQVEFTENARVPTGLTRQVQASDTRVIFLEKGCVVVRELVDEGGKKVVKSTALPLNSGLVRSIVLEDEIVNVEQERAVFGALAGESVHPGGLEHDPMKPWASLAMGMEGRTRSHPTNCKCGGKGFLELPAENGLTYELCPVAPSENPQQGAPPGVAEMSKLMDMSQRTSQVEVALGGPGPAGTTSAGEHVPANAEEALLNQPAGGDTITDATPRRPRRR